MSFVKHAENQLARHAQHLNAYVSRSSPEVCKLGVAVAAKRRAEGVSFGDIDGKLFAIKDNICTRDLPTTCASHILKSFKSPFDATVVKLIQDAGGVIVGKTNLDEFGMGSHNLNSRDGPTLNLHSRNGEKLSTGGSSGGSAAAVADNTCYAALGTDTGGSVRLPAAYCGVVGFKPSYGRLSRFGVVAYANSLDTVGILAQRVEPVAQLFESLDLPDRKDPTCLTSSDRQYLDRSSVCGRPKRLRIGLPVEYNIKELDTNVRDAWTVTAQTLRDQGHELVPVNLPSTAAALAAYYILAPAEASSNLAKYDGIRYGNPSLDRRSATDVLFSRTRFEGLGSEVRRRILLGSYSLSSTAIDNYFIQSQRVRRQVQQDFNHVFKIRHPFLDLDLTSDKNGVDFLLVPTAPSQPPTHVEVRERSPVQGYRDDVFTVPASLAGLPAMSIPFTFDTAEPHSIGIQLVGQYGEDRFLLKVGQELEAAMQR